METLKGSKRKLSSAFVKSSSSLSSSAKRADDRFSSILQYLRRRESQTHTAASSSSSSSATHTHVIAIDDDDDNVEDKEHEREALVHSRKHSKRSPVQVISLVEEESEREAAEEDNKRIAMTHNEKPAPFVVDLSVDDIDECPPMDPVMVIVNEEEKEKEKEKEREKEKEKEREMDLCLVCDADLSALDEAGKEAHLHCCLGEQGVDGPQCSLPAVPSHDNTTTHAKQESVATAEEEERGLRLPVFFCVLCDLNLSKRGLLARCLHLKKCARENNMSTRQLLQFIAPLQEEEEDEFGEEGGEENDLRPIEGDLESHKDPLPETSPCAVNPSSSSSSSSSSAKNAWSVLMDSAKQQARMKGMFDAKRSAPPVSAAGKSANSNPHPAFAPQNSANNSGNKKTRGGQFAKKQLPSAGQSGFAPAYKKIQMGNMSCPIVVDGFQYACPLLTDCYFLTHFHSDHYIGITKDFNAGLIYCSPATAALVKSKLRVSSTNLVALELDRKYTITVGGVDVDVTLTDANHCPGAVCILFHFPQLNKNILHTGDFRWNNDLLRTSQLFRKLAATADTHNLQHLTAYLDTTYCDAQYCFPHQDKAVSQMTDLINAVIDCVRAEAKIPGALFVFGAYAIGKERLFMAAAEELGVKVHVDKNRWRAMMCFDWSTEKQARLTTDPSATNLWVAPLNHINFNSLEKLRRLKPKCTRVVAFQPTGWTHQNNGSRFKSSNRREPERSNESADVQEGDGIIHARRKEGHVIYSAPYSEHSSFAELVEFVSTFKPSRIIPTVNTAPDRVQEQLKLLKQHSNAYTEKSNNPSSSETNIPLRPSNSLGTRTMPTHPPPPPPLQQKPQNASLFDESLREDEFVSEFF